MIFQLSEHVNSVTFIKLWHRQQVEGGHDGLVAWWHAGERINGTPKLASPPKIGRDSGDTSVSKIDILFVCLFYSYIRPAFTWRHAEIYLQWIFDSSICKTSMFWFRFNNFDLFVSFVMEFRFLNHCYVSELSDFLNVWIKIFRIVCFFDDFWFEIYLSFVFFVFFNCFLFCSNL